MRSAGEVELREVVGGVDVEREVAVADDAQRQTALGALPPHGSGTNRARSGT